MKKYTIYDFEGNKKIVYAKDIVKAMALVSKIKDVSLTTGDWFTLRNERDATIYKIVSVSHNSYVTDVYRVEVDFNAKRTFIKKIGSKSFYSSNIRGRNDITTLAVKFNSAEEAMNWLKKQNRLVSKMFFKENNSAHDSINKDSKIVDMGHAVPGAIVPAHQIYNPEYSIQQFKSYIGNVIRDLYGNEYNREKVRAISKLDTYVSQIIDDFKADIKNSNLDKRKTVQYYIQYVNALHKELVDVKNVQNIDKQSLKKIDDIHAKMARSIHDSKFKDTKLYDTVSLIKGDWFTLRKRNDTLYKIIDDQFKSHNGFAKALTVEVYRITFGDDLDDPYIIKKVGNESFRPDKWSSPDIVKFNSAKEAIDWLRRQLRLTNNGFEKKLSMRRTYNK